MTAESCSDIYVWAINQPATDVFCLCMDGVFQVLTMTEHIWSGVRITFDGFRMK